MKCIISIAGKYSNVAQVAPRMTREGPYLYCHLSYTIFFSSVEFSLELISWKERSEGDASTEVIASFYCINNTNPQRNKFIHIYLVYLQKKSQQRTSDKVENETENEMKSEPRARTSTHKEEKKENYSPKLQNKCLLYFAFTIAFHKLPNVKLKLQHQVG